MTPDSQEPPNSHVAFTQELCEPMMERSGSLQDADRSFDVRYWQQQGDAANFQAAWEMVEFYWRDLGLDPNELRLQRTVEAFHRP